MRAADSAMLRRGARSSGAPRRLGLLCRFPCAARRTHVNLHALVQVVRHHQVVRHAQPVRLHGVVRAIIHGADVAWLFGTRALLRLSATPSHATHGSGTHCRSSTTRAPWAAWRRRRRAQQSGRSGAPQRASRVLACRARHAAARARPVASQLGAQQRGEGVRLAGRPRPRPTTVSCHATVTAARPPLPGASRVAGKHGRPGGDSPEAHG